MHNTAQNSSNYFAS